MYKLIHRKTQVFQQFSNWLTFIEYCEFIFIHPETKFFESRLTRLSGRCREEQGLPVRTRNPSNHRIFGSNLEWRKNKTLQWKGTETKIMKKVSGPLLVIQVRIQLFISFELKIENYFEEYYGESLLEWNKK